MQPFLVPDAPALMAYGFLWAFAGMFALLVVARMERYRFLAALVIVLLCVGGTVYAAQPVLNPCSAVEPGSWLWYLSGCFLG